MNNILIVEDNEVSRNNLEIVLNNNFNNIRVFQCKTGQQAFRLLNEANIDLFFLDIHLPDISGLQIAEKLRSMEEYELAYIIFVSAHVTYLPTALQKYNCYDFIEKPFNKDQVIKVTNRLLKGVKMNGEQNRNEKYIIIQLKDILYKISVHDIYYVEAHRRTLYIHTTNGKIKVPSMTFKQMVEMIEEIGVDYLVRTHRSFMINLQYVKSIRKIKKKAWDVSFYGYEDIACVGEKYKVEILNRVESNI